MSIAQLQQDYHLSALTYQIERLFELKSGPLLYDALGPYLSQLNSRQIQTLINTHPQSEIQEICGLYLLTQHFKPGGLQALAPESRHKLMPLLQEFVPALLRELEELLRQSPLQHHFLARTLLLNEIEFLELLLKEAALEIKPLTERTLFFKCCLPWLSLLSSHPEQPTVLLKQILQAYGWDERWQTSTKTYPNILQRQAPKHEIAQYKLSESGRLLQVSLEKYELLSQAFYSEIQTHVTQRIKNTSFHILSDYEQQIREMTQVVMQLAVRKHASVEKISSLLAEVFLKGASASHQATRTMILFTLTQEQVLGTQNLKYRLNDVTRGLAVSLARLIHDTPVWEQDLVWVWHALIDTILEVYESFNLADNALRSFNEAFMQEKQKLVHISWKEAQPAIQQLLHRHAQH